MSDISQKVRDANKKIYTLMGGKYDLIDGRRSDDLRLFIEKRLRYIHSILKEKDSFLDIGSGTGFVANIAKKVFTNVYSLDISECILKSASSYGALPICADAIRLPIKDNTLDVVVFFSAAHHFYDIYPVFDEASRVLKPGGIIYMDHDINMYFFKKYEFFMRSYRKLFRNNKELEAIGIKKELYELSEYHSKGIDSKKIESYLLSLGFRIIKSYYHWYGLSKITDILFKERVFSEANAPLFGLIAQR